MLRFKFYKLLRIVVYEFRPKAAVNLRGKNKAGHVEQKLLAGCYREIW